MTLPRTPDAIAIAFPKRPEDRARLQSLLPPGSPFPALYDHAETDCHDCGVLLDVGPSIARLTTPVIVVCPECGIKRTADFTEITLFNLGNPDSKPE